MISIIKEFRVVVVYLLELGNFDFFLEIFNRFLSILIYERIISRKIS